MQLPDIKVSLPNEPLADVPGHTQTLIYSMFLVAKITMGTA